MRDGPRALKPSWDTKEPFESGLSRRSMSEAIDESLAIIRDSTSYLYEVKAVGTMKPIAEASL